MEFQDKWCYVGHLFLYCTSVCRAVNGPLLNLLDLMAGLVLLALALFENPAGMNGQQHTGMYSRSHLDM